MGLFDFMKKKTNENVQDVPPQPRDKIAVNRDQNGNIRIQYTQAETPYMQGYDKTQLTIENTAPIQTAHQPVYNCNILWQDSKDDMAIRFDDNGRPVGSQLIQVGLNMDLIKEGNAKYLKPLMLSLLNKNRINDYLERGCQDNPEIPCGNYVGEIDLIDGQYKKSFDQQVGKASHVMYKAQREELQKEQAKIKENRMRENNPTQNRDDILDERE